EAAFGMPETGGGETTQASATWGVSNDRGYIAAAAEYFRREQMSVRDKDLMCDRHWEVDENGRVRHDEVDVPPGVEINPCKTQIIGRFRNLFGVELNPLFDVPGRHSDYFFTPGTTNIGIPNFSDDIDFDNNGFIDVNEKDPLYNGADYRRSIVQNQDFISPLERLTFTAFGNYRIESLNDMETFFELSYANRKNKILSSGAQIFPTVPADNPTNPCGVQALADAGNPDLCGGLIYQILQDPALTPPEFLIDPPILPLAPALPVVPIVLIEGDRNNTEVELSQIRLVGGIRGDLPFWNSGSGDGLFGFNNWNYEVSGSYHRSFGTSVRRGIIEDRLTLSLNTTRVDVDDEDGDGETDDLVCGIGGIGSEVFGDLFGFLDPLNCVPVNLFSEDVMRFNRLTPEEREFLFGVRTFATEIEQAIVSGFVGGDIMSLPAGPVGFVLGGEWRRDEIDSRPDDNAEDGNFIGFFADKGAIGSREFKEGFAEIRIPVLSGLPFAHELTIEAAGRVTNETFYGTNWTYGVKGLYQPFQWLTFRGSYGTSFRAPNLREFFFRGSTGFVSPFNDPCIVPLEARTGGAYDPTKDDRDPAIIQGCMSDGVDPFSLGLGPTSSIEVETGSNKDLVEETSTTYTVGAVLDVPYAALGMGDAFTTQISATHFNIDVRNTIEEPNTNFIIEECYRSDPAGLSSPFCDRFDRVPGTGFVDLVDARFINIGQVTSVGFDFNTLFGYRGIELGERALDLRLDARATWLLEQTETIETQFDDNLGEVGTPKWRGQATLFADWWDFRLLWRTRFIDSQETDFPDAFGANDTCQPVTGIVPLDAPPEDEPGTVIRDTSDALCRDVGHLDQYWLNNASLTWRRETWSLTAGVNNVFDVDPPRADSSEILTSAAGNFPLGVGYDFFGRTYFVNVAKRF
ncbi:MAG: TonB-dependent receptor domain-containing protein, partial [Alphaproteobacteria bacterium]